MTKIEKNRTSTLASSEPVPEQLPRPAGGRATEGAVQRRVRPTLRAPGIYVCAGMRHDASFEVGDEVRLRLAGGPPSYAPCPGEDAIERGERRPRLGMVRKKEVPCRPRTAGRPQSRPRVFFFPGRARTGPASAYCINSAALKLERLCNDEGRRGAALLSGTSTFNAVEKGIAARVAARLRAGASLGRVSCPSLAPCDASSRPPFGGRPLFART